MNGSLLSDCKWATPECFTVDRQNAAESTVRYSGPKPIPSSISVSGGFRLPMDPKEVVKNSNLAMQTFTQEFYHRPEKDFAKSSNEAQSRF